MPFFCNSFGGVKTGSPPQALEATPKAPPPAARAPAPQNAGKPWSEDDDATLLAAFDRGDDLRTIAEALARTKFGVEQRLVKLGRIGAPVGGGRYGATTSAASAAGAAGAPA
ncbi:MAG: hypothetical protein AB7P99_13170 [Vicinamibacterales bacterium]